MYSVGLIDVVMGTGTARGDGDSEDLLGYIETREFADRGFNMCKKTHTQPPGQHMETQNEQQQTTNQKQKL